ncbi:MAG: hypothetical protein IH984_08315 [Planctomycetes bacterium]|nr:hypothetical protein [Planctomycetota bacterium]
MITPSHLVVEVIHGDISPLLRGSATPDESFVYKLPVLLGDASKQRSMILQQEEHALLLRICQRINVRRIVVLEWSRTTEQQMLFHDWLESDGSEH